MAKQFREDRFRWEEDQVKFTPSQCRDCDHNAGIEKCEVFGTKPEKYATNDEKCPERKT